MSKVNSAGTGSAGADVIRSYKVEQIDIKPEQKVVFADVHTSGPKLYEELRKLNKDEVKGFNFVAKVEADSETAALGWLKVKNILYNYKSCESKRFLSDIELEIPDIW